MVFLKITNLIVYNVPYLAIKTPITYFQETNKLNIYGNGNQLGDFTGIKHIKSKDNKELYIIVIGESASKVHFQLYNYYRKTTPLLNSIKDELIILNDVISPHAYTIGSLTKGLTLGNVENPEGKYQGSIIQLLNQVGFKTYWISNQRPVGVSDTQVTQIAKGARKSIFLNIKHTSENTPYDEVLLPELNKIAQEKGNKKVVFLHMIGEHFYYEKRYPPEFDYFKDIPITKFDRDDVYKTINAYDNAIRYTDSILNEVIKTARRQNTDSFVLYFSDHGQEVYDDIDFFGQTIDQMVTKSMYEIPMFLWMSESYKLKNQIALNLNKKYMTDDVIHSIADLCNVTSNEIDSTRSIFNEHFKQRKRIIKNNIDFDASFYLNENQ
ncbi:phosphoethanolamine transferase [Confluentibacter lentus]|uniref:phosphoethanolamine transferase n=1 Tax=Confluentibacter lentus TaxID=1699412 RepID=UPI001E2FBF42|nr:phosphoethanolamine transferase [Confluentibacter lentus]